MDFRFIIIYINYFNALHWDKNRNRLIFLYLKGYGFDSLGKIRRF